MVGLFRMSIIRLIDTPQPHNFYCSRIAIPYCIHQVVYRELSILTMEKHNESVYSLFLRKGNETYGKRAKANNESLLGKSKIPRA
jgi:hypothetical protein